MHGVLSRAEILGTHISSCCQCRREDEASGQSTKTIIFCTFTKALDLMEARLAQTGACWQRLDGKMRLEQRSAVTREFAQDPEVRCPICLNTTQPLYY